METKRPSPLYRCIRGAVAFFYPRMEVVGTEHLPGEPCILVGNHSQMHGPICAELYVPRPHYTWCAGEMMHLKEVPDYAFRDFWSQKPRWTHPGYRLLSYLIAPLSAVVFNGAHTLGVYRDGRAASTFKNTVKRLQEGNDIVIFPEHDVKRDHIIYDFQERFIDVARLYHRRTGRALAFVPLYIAPKLRQMHLGEPIRFDPEAPIEEERARIRGYLMDAVTDMACALPEHTVIPYRNIPKRYYPSNIPGKAIYEKADC